MKKIISLLLCVCMLFIVGCDKKEDISNDQVKEDITINLNDNVYYISYIQLTNKSCGGFGFPKDIEEKIDSRWLSKYEDMKAVDLIELSSHEDITWDIEKENSALKEWNKLSLPTKGINNGTLGYENHSFYFGYYYIELAKENGEDLESDNPYYEFNNEMIKERVNFENTAYEIIKSRNGYRLAGTCGSPVISGQLLDEMTCEQYNLKCGRW